MKRFFRDAQTAIFEGNLRRAVLELAIASELVVERKFLSGNSTARAYNKVRVLSYIDGLAKKRFGKSFKEDHCDHYTNIDHLLRVRNKVAHIGDLLRLDDKGNRIDVDYELVARWWDSVIRLIDWLGSLR